MVYPLLFLLLGKNLITEAAYRRRSFLGLMVPEDKVHHGSGIRGQARYQEQEVEVRSHILNQMNKIEKGHSEGLKSLKPKSLL